MFNLNRMSQYYLRVAIAILIVGAILFAVSLIAVASATINYNQPIIPTCTGSIDENILVTAIDKDGVVISVDVAYDQVSETLNLTAQSVITGVVAETGDKIHVALSDIIPATTEGGQLTAKLNVVDTAPEGLHNIELIFSNNDMPVVQTATCHLTVQVTKVQNPDGVATVATVQSVENSTVLPDTNVSVRQFTANVFGGMVPGVAGIVIAILLCISFINTLYRLGSVREGQQFIIFRIFGRPEFAPYLIIQEGKILTGPDSIKRIGGPAGLVVRQDSAVITEKEGKLARIIRGPMIPSLEPFEKIWDIIDLRLQRWPFKVSAVTKDGIPIYYEVAIKFRVGDTDDDILKAATCKWIREAWRTEPDRIMDWPKRMMNNVEGILRNILAQYSLNELHDAHTRQQIHRDLFDMLKVSSAQDLGVEIIEVSLHDITFLGQVLEEWAKTWETQRDLEVAKIESNERVQELKMRERAKDQVRQEMLDSTVKTLNAMAKKRKGIPVNYVLLSLINMIEHTAAAQEIFIPEDKLVKLEKIKKELDTY